MNSGIINFDKLKEIIGNNKDDIISFFNLFKEQTAIEITNLNKFIKEKEWIKSAEIAHKLKSTYGSIGSTLAYDLLANIENICKNMPDEMSILDNFSRFLDVQQNLIKGMDDFLNS